jgi:hypothetical protein
MEEGRMSENGARYAIVVDGVVRTHRDTLEVALEAASVLKACHPTARSSSAICGAASRSIRKSRERPLPARSDAG